MSKTDNIRALFCTVLARVAATLLVCVSSLILEFDIFNYIMELDVK